MPWGISHKHKFIFVHIPKTAGTTICSNWHGSPLKDICTKNGVLGGTHKSALQLKEMFPVEWEEYLTFTVVRNPYSRFISKFFFKQLNPRPLEDLESCVWDDREAEGLLPQLYWITDRNDYFLPTSQYDHPDIHFGDIIVDRVLRYENLNAEIKDLFDELGIPPQEVLPHFRETQKIENPGEYFPTHFKALVTYLYREDLKRFGYEYPYGDREYGTSSA